MVLGQRPHRHWRQRQPGLNLGPQNGPTHREASIAHGSCEGFGVVAAQKLAFGHGRRLD
jgi:hypothetical protein